MARFGFSNGELSMAAIEEIPDPVVAEMLEQGALVAMRAQQEQIRILNLVDSVQLFKSLRAFPKVDKNGHRYTLIYPYGKRHNPKRKKLAYNRKKKKYYVVNMNNNDVGFIHEFGAPIRGIPAKQWMQTANEKAADAIVEAEFKKYDEWLSSMGY